MLHVRWTIHHGDLTATTDVDVRAAHDSVANVGGLFPMTAHRAAAESQQRLRIAVAGRMVFDRALTRDEARRLASGATAFRIRCCCATRAAARSCSAPRTTRSPGSTPDTPTPSNRCRSLPSNADGSST